MRPRGQPVVVCLARVSVILGATGRRMALRWTLRPLDAGEQLAGAHIAETELARRIVEDFRGPVLTIAGWARLLLDGSIDDDEERMQAFCWMEQSAAAQRVMLDDLAELTDLHCEEQPLPSAQPVDLLERVRAALDGLRAFIDPASLRLENGVPGDAALVRIPPPLLDRALDLLLRHALAGTPRNGGAVSVRVSRIADEIVLSVEAPSGAAVPAGWRVRIATVAHLVAMCGGRLALSDQGPSATITLRPATTDR
jgi:signal transduction histidine kinase